MARRKLAKVDLCKIDTDRFKHMTYKQLKTAQERVGKLYELHVKEKAYPQPTTKATALQRARGLLASYLTVLANTRDPNYHLPDDPKLMARVREIYKHEPVSNAKIVAGYKSDVEYFERRIWDAQAIAGCRIRPDEQVARDAIREGGEGNLRKAAKLRKKPFIR